MSPNEFAFLRIAAMHCRFHRRVGTVSDYALNAGVFDSDIDPVLADWKHRGWWDYTITPRAGWVTRAGYLIAFPPKPEQQLAAA